eukprot:g3336.t1
MEMKQQKLEELRLDSSDFNLYPKSSFVETYGGLDEWIESERRIDKSNNSPFRKQDFLEYYGGLRQWKSSRLATEDELSRFAKEVKEKKENEVTSSTQVKRKQAWSTSPSFFDPSIEIFDAWMKDENRIRVRRPKLPGQIFKVMGKKVESNGKKTPIRKKLKIEKHEKDEMEMISRMSRINTPKYDLVTKRVASFNFGKGSKRFSTFESKSTVNIRKKKIVSYSSHETHESDNNGNENLQQKQNLPWVRMSRGIAAKKFKGEMTSGLRKLLREIEEENKSDDLNKMQRNRRIGRSRKKDFQYDGYGRAKVGTYGRKEKKIYNVITVPMHELRKAYEQVDDHDGYISFEEFQMIWKIAGVAISKDKVEKLFGFMDINEDGKVEWEEMEFAMERARIQLRKPKLKKKLRKKNVSPTRPQSTRRTNQNENEKNDDLLLLDFYARNVDECEKWIKRSVPGGRWGESSRFPKTRKESDKKMIQTYRERIQEDDQRREEGKIRWKRKQFGFSSEKRHTFVEVDRDWKTHMTLANLSPGPQRMRSPRFRGRVTKFGEEKKPVKVVKGIDREREGKIEIEKEENWRLPQELLKEPPKWETYAAKL